MSNAYSKFNIWFTNDKTTLVRLWTETCCFNSTEAAQQTSSFNSHSLYVQVCMLWQKYVWMEIVTCRDSLVTAQKKGPT
jgi:hypothetical protein